MRQNNSSTSISSCVTS